MSRRRAIYPRLPTVPAKITILDPSPIRPRLATIVTLIFRHGPTCDPRYSPAIICHAPLYHVVTLFSTSHSSFSRLREAP
jgi:hypothetical protein